jgi:hypothetical protein
MTYVTVKSKKAAETQNSALSRNVKTLSINSIDKKDNISHTHGIILHFVVKKCAFFAVVNGMFIFTPLSTPVLNGIIRMIFSA